MDRKNAPVNRSHAPMDREKAPVNNPSIIRSMLGTHPKYLLTAFVLYARVFHEHEYRPANRLLNVLSTGEYQLNYAAFQLCVYNVHVQRVSSYDLLVLEYGDTQHLSDALYDWLYTQYARHVLSVYGCHCCAFAAVYL